MTVYLPTDNTPLQKRLSHLDRSAFEKVYDQYYLYVFQFSMKYLDNRQVAEDITLETFAKLWDRRTDISAISNISALLYTIARNACLNHLRDEERLQHRYQELARQQEDQELPFESLTDIRSAIYQRLYQEIENLPGKMPQVMQLSLKGLKNAAIADHAGISEKTVRNLKTEAIKQLRTKLLKHELWMLIMLISH